MEDVRARSGSLRRKLNRRALIAHSVKASALVAGGAALACNGRSVPNAGKQPPTSAAAMPPKKGGVLTYAGGSGYAYDTQKRTFDPCIQTQFGAKGYALFYERLLGYDLRSFEIQPELAQKWEQPSQTEFVFHLQPNVKWQNKPPVNGRPLVAEDVVWSLERARTDDPKFFSRSLLARVDQITAPDQATVRITTKVPDVATLQTMSIENLFILSREVFEKYPRPATADAAVGTGPFVMKSLVDLVSSEYVRNPNYWKPGTPYMDGFRTRAFADALTGWSAYLANQVDITQVPGTEVKNYLDQRGSGFTPEWYRDDNLVGYLCPNTKSKPLDDPRVTRALRLLLDHQELIKAWAEPQYGRGRYGSIFPAALSDWDLTDDEYAAHLEWKQPKDDASKEAISLLTAAGITKDNPLTFPFEFNQGQTGEAEAQLIQSQWKRFSQGAIDIRLKGDDTATLDSVRASRSFAYASYGFSAGMAEPGTWLSTTYRTGGSLNFMGTNDATLDSMIDKQQTIFDAAQRKSAIKAIVDYMLDNGPSTIGANLFFLYGVKPKVHGYAPEHGLNGRQYQWIWLDS
jgi:peptide/nickel transport system substrate-binding protein